ncbi:MAG TPA: type 4a pilus biogenesis protein PilO, partial [Acidimicrobiia bacterium]|nr:type 4a pilus biogenesis protein PilO [Acidimicrobiia bacterium]
HLHRHAHPRRPLQPGRHAGQGGAVKPGRRPPKRTGGAGRSTSRAVIALAVMGSLVLVYGWNSFFLAPRNRAKAAAVHDLSAARTQEQTLKQNLAQLKKLAADTKTREAELVRLGRLVPADPDVAGAILALNDTANQAQVAWSSFVPSTPAATGGGPVSVGISMKVGGSFSQVFDYLRRLELLDRLVVIDSLQLAGGSGTSGASRIDADIKGRMFSAAATAGSSPSTAAALPKAGG